MKAMRYDVELVFACTLGERKLCIREASSYCTCKRGAIATNVCSHRRAVLYWLRTLWQKWSGLTDSIDNFHDLAQKLNIAADICDTSQLPISVQQLVEIHNNTVERGRKNRHWSDVTEAKIRHANKNYLETDSDKALFLQVAEKARRMNKSGEIRLTKYPMLAMWADLMDPTRHPQQQPTAPSEQCKSPATAQSS